MNVATFNQWTTASITIVLPPSVTQQTFIETKISQIATLNILWRNGGHYIRYRSQLESYKPFDETQATAAYLHFLTAALEIWKGCINKNTEVHVRQADLTDILWTVKHDLAG